MQTVGKSLLVLGFLAALSWCAQAHATDEKDGGREKKPVPKVPVGKDTTYVDGPFDKDGYIDYEAALNKRLGEGVKPETNAVALLWTAFGPRPDGAEMPTEFYKWLGIQAPPQRGDYYLNLVEYMKNNPNVNRDEWRAINDQLDWAGVRPWAGRDYPHIAAWLKLNEKPLAVVARATRRRDYFHPLVSRKGDKGPGSLIRALLPAVQKCRELASALPARAMLNAGEGKYDEAWQDLLAGHRLARHVGRGGTLIEGLVGIALEQLFASSDLVLLDGGKLTARQVRGYLKDLQGLPPMLPMADRIDLAERFIFLDAVQRVRGSGVKALAGLVQVPGDFDAEAIEALGRIDWAPALRAGNRRYDRLVAALRRGDRADREKQLDLLEKELNGQKKGAAGLAELLKKKAQDEAAGEAVGDVLVRLMLPAARKTQQAADRAEQSRRNLQLAFALAAYRLDNRRYPETLDALAPKYLAKVPGDLFSGRAMVYFGGEKGYLLYSVGVNGEDEGGRWYDDTPRGDDPRVRMPLPELKRR